MSTKNFFKIKKIGLACGMAMLVVGAVCLYALRLSNAEKVQLPKSYYFVVSTDFRIEAGTEFVKLEGGAGYLLEADGREYVAYSVYEDRKQGEAVQAALAESGKRTKLVRMSTQTLYFKGKEKKNSALYVNALRLLEEYTSVLSECISRLEKGMTQQKCKKLLGLLQRQFAFVQTEYAEYRAFAQICAQAEKALNDVRQGTVYAKDLRRLLCWQAENYVRLCSAFAL